MCRKVLMKRHYVGEKMINFSICGQVTFNLLEMATTEGAYRREQISSFPDYILPVEQCNLHKLCISHLLERPSWI